MLWDSEGDPLKHWMGDAPTQEDNGVRRIREAESFKGAVYPQKNMDELNLVVLVVFLVALRP